MAGILGGFILAPARAPAARRSTPPAPSGRGALQFDDLPAKKRHRGLRARHSEVSGDLSFMNIVKAQEEIEAAAAGNEALIRSCRSRHHRHDRRRQADETLIPSWRAA